jgi:hypothetical protein
MNMKLTTAISTAVAVLLAFFQPVNAEASSRIFGKKKGSDSSSKHKKKKTKGSADSSKQKNPRSYYTPYHTDSTETLGPAAHCLLDQDLLEGSYVSYDTIDAQYPCLRDFCASFTTAEECNLDANFLKGCGWCNGGCTAYFAFQVAFVECVRVAYVDHEPTKINSKELPFQPSNATYDTSFANFPIGLPEQGGVENLGNKRWASSEVGRPAGERVPIHLHPFAGLSCLDTEGGTTIAIEGHDNFHVRYLFVSHMIHP